MLNTSNPRFSVASQLGFRITTSIQPKALDHLSLTLPHADASIVENMLKGKCQM